MIKIEKLTNIHDRVIFQTFTEAFSDYMVKMEFTNEKFMEHMFIQEGNQKDYSFLAYEDEKPVGIILGAINTAMPIKTLRCGALGVIKEKRGTNVARQLMEAHIRLAKELECKRVYLEVIKGNDRAISFYQKMGYVKVYDLIYKTLDLSEKNSFENDNSFDETEELREVSFDEMKKLREIDSSHLPWQSCFDYFKSLDVESYGIFIEGNLIGGIVASDRRIFYLYVMPKYRRFDFYEKLLSKVIHTKEVHTLKIMYSNNDILEYITGKCGFKTDPLSQFEMFRNV